MNSTNKIKGSTFFDRLKVKSLNVVIPVRQPKHVRYVELHPCKNEMALFETVHLIQNVIHSPTPRQIAS